MTTIASPIDPTRVRRLDFPPPEPTHKRSFRTPPNRSHDNGWASLREEAATDPLCTGAPLGMTVRRTTDGTDVVVYWSRTDG